MTLGVGVLNVVVLGCRGGMETGMEGMLVEEWSNGEG